MSLFRTLRESATQPDLPIEGLPKEEKTPEKEVDFNKFPETDEEAIAQGYDSLEDFRQSQHLDSIMTESKGSVRVKASGVMGALLEDWSNHMSEPMVIVTGVKDGDSKTMIFDGSSESLAKEEFLRKYPGYEITKCELEESGK